jgi:hypothetical protein
MTATASGIIGALACLAAFLVDRWYQRGLRSDDE